MHTVRGALPIPDGRTLGHESVGVIHKLGSAVTGFEVGQRVAVNAITPCYRCDGLPDAKAVYACDMLSTGFMGVEHAYLNFGGTVAVFAQGLVGLSATMGAHLMGAGRIIAVESKPERKALAQRFGADDVVDFTEGDPVEQIMSLTGPPSSSRPPKVTA